MSARLSVPTRVRLYPNTTPGAFVVMTDTMRHEGMQPAYLVPEDEWKIAKKALAIVRKRAKSLRRDDPILFEESKGALTALAMKLNVKPTR